MQHKDVTEFSVTFVLLQDRLGLAAMDKAGKLAFLASEGDHLQFTREWFNTNLLPYLRATRRRT